jgi:hypothetical protein
MIACMMRSAIIALQVNGVGDGLEQGAWSDADLVALEQDLAGLHVSPCYGRAIDSQRGWLNAFHDSLADQTPWGRARAVRKWFPEKGPFPTLLAAWCSWGAVVRDGQLLINRQLDVVRQQIDAEGNWQPRTLPYDLDHMGRPREFRYAMSLIILANFSRAERRLVTVEAWVRQARLAVAIERFRRSHGSLPARVEDVVPQFLPAMLRDPYDSAPMRYAKDSANRYRLWSVGDNLKDDGGRPDPESIDVKLDLVWTGSTPGK